MRNYIFTVLFVLFIKPDILFLSFSPQHASLFRLDPFTTSHSTRLHFPT